MPERKVTCDIFQPRQQGTWLPVNLLQPRFQAAREYSTVGVSTKAMAVKQQCKPLKRKSKRKIIGKP